MERERGERVEEKRKENGEREGERDKKHFLNHLIYVIYVA